MSAESDDLKRNIAIDPGIEPNRKKIRGLPSLLINRPSQRMVLISGDRFSSIEVAADELAEGRVIGMNMCGAQGLVVCGTNQEAIYQLLEMKERTIGESLIVGAGEYTRRRLIDRSRIPTGYRLPKPSDFDIPHFFEYQVRPDLLLPGVGRTNEWLGRTAAIFWGNYYLPLSSLEMALQQRVPGGFLAGSSANLHGQPQLETAKEVFNVFARTGRVRKILVDEMLERGIFFSGRHTMLGYGENGTIRVLREGSITARSFKQIYPKLLVPETWQDGRNSVDVDIRLIRTRRSYLKSKLIAA